MSSKKNLHLANEKSNSKDLKQEEKIIDNPENHDIHSDSTSIYQEKHPVESDNSYKTQSCEIESFKTSSIPLDSNHKQSSQNNHPDKNQKLKSSQGPNHIEIKDKSRISSIFPEGDKSQLQAHHQTLSLNQNCKKKSSEQKNESKVGPSNSQEPSQMSSHPSGSGNISHNQCNNCQELKTIMKNLNKYIEELERDNEKLKKDNEKLERDQKESNDERKMLIGMLNENQIMLKLMMSNQQKSSSKSGSSSRKSNTPREDQLRQRLISQSGSYFECNLREQELDDQIRTVNYTNSLFMRKEEDIRKEFNKKKSSEYGNVKNTTLNNSEFQPKDFLKNKQSGNEHKAKQQMESQMPNMASTIALTTKPVGKRQQKSDKQGVTLSRFEKCCGIQLR